MSYLFNLVRKNTISQTLGVLPRGEVKDSQCPDFAILKALVILNKVPHIFCFALGPANVVASPNHEQTLSSQQG